MGTHGAYETWDPKKVEGEHFAIQLAHALKNGWDQHQYASLVIISPAHFYALLKNSIFVGEVANFLQHCLDFNGDHD